MTAYCVTPTGDLVIYATAAFAVRSTNGKTELFVDHTQEQWVADIPAEWAISWTRPHLGARDAPLKEIKRALQNFDARNGRWKD